MGHDPHIGFIVAAYALAFVIVVGMIATIMVDYRNLTRALSSFAVRDAANRESNRPSGNSRRLDEEGQD
ncbi:MAG TPA: heme exporter protein CcmD [Methylocella sp.]|nr:heme exporter protein CcmD [Methylocella sp.]